VHAGLTLEIEAILESSPEVSAALDVMELEVAGRLVEEHAVIGKARYGTRIAQGGRRLLSKG